MRTVEEILQTDALLKMDRAANNRAHPTANHSMHNHTSDLRPSLNVDPSREIYDKVPTTGTMPDRPDFRVTKTHPGTGTMPERPGDRRSATAQARRSIGGGFFSRLFRQKHEY